MYSKKQARELYEKGDLKEAYPAFCELTKRYPRNGLFLATLAFLEIEVNHNLSQAEKLLEEARAHNCPKAFFHRICGCLFSKRKMYSQAVKEYECCVAIEASLSNLCAFGEALSIIRDARARQVWEKVLEKKPTSCRAYFHLSQEILRCGDQAKALEMARKAESLEPSNPAVLFQIGRICHTTGQIQQAIEYYLKADKNDHQEKGYLYAAIADCYVLIGNKSESSKFMQKALRIEPENNYVQLILEKVGNLSTE